MFLIRAKFSILARLILSYACPEEKNNYRSAHIKYNIEQAQRSRDINSWDRYLCVYMIRMTLIMLFIIITCFQGLYARKVVWDVTQLFGVTTSDARPGTDLALDSARNHFSDHPGDTICLYYPAGDYYFMGEEPSIDFRNGFISGSLGRLEITGDGYENTIFITRNPRADAIYGRDVYRVLFRGIHFTRDYVTVIQGDVVSVGPGSVVLELHKGFPAPDSLIQFGRRNEAGLYLKRYTDDPDDPHIIPESENNEQIPWDTANTYLVSGRTWNFGLKKPEKIAPYKAGDVIGVKLKHGGQTYWLSGGDDIVFENCKWTRKTRGVLRGGISNIRFSDCLIDRGPKVGGRTPCLASPGGGPQCGQPNDPRIRNVIIENCVIISTGDDNCALFNVDGGTVRNCYFSDGFAEAPRITQCRSICLENNTYVRCSPLWVVGSGGDTASDCSVPDFDPPSKPGNLSAECVSHNSATITWDPSTDNTGLSHYDVYRANHLIGTTEDTIFQVTGLSPGVYYVFGAEAVDMAGNRSGLSDYLGITTPEEPVTYKDIFRRGAYPSTLLDIYPDPSNSFLHLALHKRIRGGRLSIVDLNGRSVFQAPLESMRTTIEISSLKPGIYLLTIRFDRESLTAKLYIP